MRSAAVWGQGHGNPTSPQPNLERKRKQSVLQEPPPEGTVEIARYRPGLDQARLEADLDPLFRDNLDPDLAPFRRGAPWPITAFADFVKRFNATVPRHELGEGNAALLVVRNGTVHVHWLRGKDNHWRVRGGRFCFWRAFFAYCNLLSLLLRLLPLCPSKPFARHTIHAHTHHTRPTTIIKTDGVHHRRAQRR
jgi:hypothetical protein